MKRILEATLHGQRQTAVGKIARDCLLIATVAPRHCSSMRRFTPWTIASVALALLHTLPARHHLEEMLASFTLSDAWKGVGAAGAVALLVVPVQRQARVIALLRRAHLLFLAALVLVVVHLVPALDHVPKFLASPTFADGWRALGSCLAIVWFGAPRDFQLAVMRRSVTTHLHPRVYRQG